MKIIIIGPPGSGKTSTGQILAKNLGFRFADTDDLVEARVGLKVSEIFTQKGEQSFRASESEILEDLHNKANFPEDMILATGGGLPVQSGNFSRLVRLGEVVCLTASLPKLVERLSGDSTRPLLQSKEPVAQCQEIEILSNRLARLLAERTAIYAQARYTIETSNLSPAGVAAEIQRVLCLGTVPKA